MKPYIQRPFYHGFSFLVYFVNRVPHEARVRDPNDITTTHLQVILDLAKAVQDPNDYQKAWAYVCKKELTARLIGARKENEFLEARQLRNWTRLQTADDDDKPLEEIRYAYPR